jgi:hypothetical protein
VLSEAEYTLPVGAIIVETATVLAEVFKRQEKFISATVLHDSQE